MRAVEESRNALEEGDGIVDAAGDATEPMNTTASAKNMSRPWMKSVTTTDR